MQDAGLRVDAMGIMLLQLDLVEVGIEIRTVQQQQLVIVQSYDQVVIQLVKMLVISRITLLLFS